MENAEFLIRNIRLQNDEMGESFQKFSAGCTIVFVPIFDGFRALSNSMKEWLLLNFPGFIDDFHGQEDEMVRIGLYKW